MRKSLITLFLCTAILMSGCQSNSTPETELSESANNTDISNDDTSAGESQETVSEPDDEPLTVDDIPEPISKEHPALPYTGKEELPDFTGMTISENAEETVMLNNKGFGYNPVCFDSDNNVYFSNPRDRQSLYVYDGEASKCLVKLPVHDLQYYNGSIYFISSGKTVSIIDYTPHEGFLYKYDPESKELTRLTDFFITQPLYVGSEGIIYLDNDDTEEKYLTAYKLDEESGELTPLYIGIAILNYNGYHYIGGRKYNEANDEYFTQVGLSDGDNSFCLITNYSGEKGVPVRMCIANGKLYYKQQGNRSLTSIDLKDGTVFQFPIPSEYGSPDYTVFDGAEYILVSEEGGGYIYEFRNEDFIKYGCEVNIQMIYSGPNGIYALTSPGIGSYDFAEVTLTYDDENHEYIAKCKSIT